MSISGTDDDLPPTHQDRGIRGGHPTGNGRTAAISNLPYNRPNDDMENQIHMLEQEAYASILRAFKAQADVITWVYINVQFENLEVLIFFFNFINSRNNK